MPEAAGETFGDRPQKLIQAFQALDRQNTGKLPMPLLAKLLAQFAPDFTAEEKQELFTEADEKGFVNYGPFVKDVIFGKIKL